MLYIPSNSSDLNFADIVDGENHVLFTAEQQRTAFEKFVNNNKVLKDARGGYIARNSGLLPWNNRFDLRILQDIFTDFGKHRHSLQLSADILNVGNFINSNWGVIQELNNGSIYNYGLLSVKSITPEGVPTFQMLTLKSGTLPETPFRDYFNVANAWRMQVGLRYSF